MRNNSRKPWFVSSFNMGNIIFVNILSQGQTIKWSKERGQKDLKNSTQKTKDRATRIPLKTKGELRLLQRAKPFLLYTGIHCVTFVTIEFQ
jgi:hypothetical protein